MAAVDVQLQYLLRSYTPVILFRDWYSTDVTLMMSSVQTFEQLPLTHCFAAGDRHGICEEQEPLLIVDATANAVKQATDRFSSPCKKVTVIVFSAKGTPTN